MVQRISFCQPAYRCGTFCIEMPLKRDFVMPMQCVCVCVSSVLFLSPCLSNLSLLFLFFSFSDAHMPTHTHTHPVFCLPRCAMVQVYVFTGAHHCSNENDHCSSVFIHIQQRAPATICFCVREGVRVLLCVPACT